MSVTVNINQILSDHFANIGAFEAGTPTPYSLGPAKEINEFPDLISQVLEHDQKNEARPDPISLYLQFPDLKDNPIAELITFHVTRRGAGNFGQDSAPGRTKIYHPLQVGTEDDVEHPGFKLFSLQRLMDNYIRLVCWARDQKICLKRALWLEKVIRN